LEHTTAVRRLGIGMAALGRPGYLNLGHGDDLPEGHDVAAMERHAHAVLDAAYTAGIRDVDVARSYGRGEAFVASWLADRAVDDVRVGSKWGYTYTAGWQVDADEHEVKDHSLTTFERQIAETRDVLGDRLDRYLIHSATRDSGVLEDEAVLEALRALAEEGVAVGLSLSGPDQAATLQRALERAAEGAAPFRVVQATWNVLEPSAGAALSAAHDAGWTVIVKEGVANGRLTGRGDAGAALQPLARHHAVGIDAIALAAVLAQPFADLVLSGASTVAQLTSNLAAAAIELDADDLEHLAGLAEAPAAYWTHRSGLAWS
jgi:aryl-alcohol dehydrogenase-like predicted oxidoreductase